MINPKQIDTAGVVNSNLNAQVGSTVTWLSLKFIQKCMPLKMKVWYKSQVIGTQNPDQFIAACNDDCAVRREGRKTSVGGSAVRLKQCTLVLTSWSAAAVCKLTEFSPQTLDKVTERVALVQLVYKLRNPLHVRITLCHCEPWQHTGASFLLKRFRTGRWELGPGCFTSSSCVLMCVGEFCNATSCPIQVLRPGSTRVIASVPNTLLLSIDCLPNEVWQ